MEITLVLFLLEAGQPQGRSGAGRIKSTKNSYETVGNRTRELLACSTVPQPTAPPNGAASMSGSMGYAV